MPRFRVFMGAPLAHDSADVSGPYHWQTTTFGTVPSSRMLALTYPPPTLEAASRRISLIYENIIFRDTDELENYLNPTDDNLYSQPRDNGLEDETTATSWPATAHTEQHRTFNQRTSRSSVDLSRLKYEGETGHTQNTASYDYSDASSVFRFPAFHFNLHSLTSLSWLISRGSTTAGHETKKTSRKYTLLVAVLDIDGPDSIIIKRGADAGKEVTLLKLIIGDEDSGVCKLTVWRQTAEVWGGVDPAATTPALKKGDIVLLENIVASWTVDTKDKTAPVSLTASPYLDSRLEICYRTMPTASTDARLRPDLRLGTSDAAVRKVSDIVNWFESMAGLRDSTT